MILLERYVFRRALNALLATLLSLSATVWLTQALRQFNLVTAQGQTLLTFLHVTTLIFPSLLMVIGPVALMIAVIYTLNLLNADSELAIINASGGSAKVLLKPILLLSGGVAVLVGAMTLYFSPLALSAGTDLLAEVNSDVISSVIQEGQFMQLGAGVTIQITRRDADQTLEGIFVSDEREPQEPLVYLARRGTILRNPLGVFLVMQDGVIQRNSKLQQTISTIEFQSYAFDLSTFASRGTVSSHKPVERPTTYLLHPDAGDTYFQQHPERFIAEFHDRLSAPLYALLFGLVPLAFFGQARVTRQGRGMAITGAALTGIGLRGFGLLMTGSWNHQPNLIFLLYAVPVFAIALSLLVAFGVVTPRLPRSLSRIGGAAMALLDPRMRAGAAAR